MSYTIDNSKVPIQLSPYNALTLVSFLREYVDRDETDPKLQALKEAVNEYEDQVYTGIRNDQIDDAKAENQVNQLIGKSPIR